MKTARILSIVALSCLVTIFTLSLAISDDLWNYPARTFSQIDTLALRASGQPSEVLGEATDDVQDYTRQPIISFDTSQTPDLVLKINSTEEEVDQLYLQYQRVSGEAVLMGLKWDTLRVSDITRSIDELIVILGDIKEVKWLTQAWGWPQLDTIAVSENAAKADLAAVRSIVSTSGTIPVAYTQLKSAITSLDRITAVIGEKTDTAKQTTIYGRYQQVLAEVGEWDSLKSQLDQELASGDVTEHAKLEARILALNQIPHINQVLSVTGNNRLLDLIALTDANKLFLASDRGSVLTTTWLEDNPVVFKTLIANSSPLARQEAAIKYYLPAELKSDNIVAKDQSVEIKFDPDKQLSYVEGHLTVAAGDTRTISVETDDIWQFDPVRIDKASFQAAELTKALAGSSKLVDAIALKSSVDASIKRVTELQKQGYSPENRIQAYRQISVEMATVNQNLTQLSQLVSKTNTLGWSSESFANSLARISWRQVVLVLTVLAFLGLGVRVLKHFPPKTLPNQQFHAFAKDITSSDL